MWRTGAMTAASSDAIHWYQKLRAGKHPGGAVPAPSRFIACAAGRAMHLCVLLSKMFLPPLAGAGPRLNDGVAPPPATDMQMAQRGDATDLKLREVWNASAPPKNYLLPALEVGSFQFLLNRFDNRFIGKDYDVSFQSIRRNLRTSWTTDNDSFVVNQIGHPYQGSVYYGLARSNGLSLWESFGYAFAGSAVWEIAGETTPPSKNDQITTSVGGSFLGESLFRMSHLLLEQGSGVPSVWRELGAAAISPSLGFNRYLGVAGAKVFESGQPATFARYQAGASTTLNSNLGPSLAQSENEAAVEFSLDYGLPGKNGYQCRRPFDYFNFQVRANNRGVESLTTRGLLVGSAYEAGARYRGIWELYGSFDYLAPQLFRLSSTALSLGSTGQWLTSPALALQGHASAGLGYTAMGTVRSSAPRDDRYGLAPQMLLALRLVLGNDASLDLSARKYFAGNLVRSDSDATDRVFRGEASVTMRVKRSHLISVKYITSRRDSSLFGPNAPNQRRDTVGVYYTYQPSDGFGIVGS
jgi:hypothetical protein